uniref:SEA domain-containing protein n=1 Tax=Meloidogyne javanica TaxID=6303 RepID=A0A915MY27_MELJA
MIVSGQTFESTSTEEKRPFFDLTTIISPTTIDNQQPHKDLNELPEMKKAKELKGENEKAEIERMRELALVEEELRQKETTEGIELTTISILHLINEDEKKLNDSQNTKPMTFEESKGMHQVEPSPNAGDAVDESVGFEIKNNNFTTTISTQLNSEISFPPLHTTPKASTTLVESGQDGESSADDPFQTSTATFEDETEHEIIHETMHEIKNKEMTEPPFIEANPGDKSKIEEKVDESKETKTQENPSESTESKVEGAHPISFMEPSSTSHTENPLTQMTTTTTEEPTIMVGDKSVFEGGEDIGLPAPEKAQIHHMSSENGEMINNKEEKKEEEMIEESSKHPSINVGNTNNKEENVGKKPSENEGKIIGGIEPEDTSGIIVVDNSTSTLFTQTERILITQENIENETNNQSFDDFDKSTKILMTTISTINVEEKGEERNDDSESKTFENIDTSTPKRGDLPGGNGETTEITVEPEVEVTTEMGEKKPFAASNETSDDNDSNHIIGEKVQTTELPIITSTLNPEQAEKAKQNAFHTSFSIRFPDIEWRSEFSDLSSGAAKKLIEQIMEDLKMVLSKALSPSNALLDVNISNLRMGSVLVEGEILTTEEVTEPQTLSAALEQAILSKGGELGGNSVDTDKLQIGGHLPNAGIILNNNGVSPSLSDGQQKRDEENNNATNTGLIIGAAVVVGVLIIVFAVFAIVVFGLNNRRSGRGSMKLSGRGGGGKKREEISMVENGNGAFGQRRFVSANDVVGGGGDSHNSRQGDGVSLTALRSTNGGAGSQFTSQTNGYGTNRH